MEKDVNGATSFSDVDINAPQSNWGKYLSDLCPYFIHWGMTYDEFWHGSLDRLHDYWQANQFSIERRNQELWMQGVYFQEAIAAALDAKGKSKYPDKPHRITEMTDAEREIDNQRKLDRLREILRAHKQNWDMRHNNGS